MTDEEITSAYTIGSTQADTGELEGRDMRRAQRIAGLRAVEAAALDRAARVCDAQWQALLADVERERDIAISMLAGWCAAVDENGTGWDDWDEHYKDAMYRDGPLRALLDEAIKEERKLYRVRESLKGA